MKKNFLKEMKGKVIGIKLITWDHYENYLLIDYDDNYLLIETVFRDRFYLPISNAGITDGDSNKFFDYQKRHDEDPNFRGDMDIPDPETRDWLDQHTIKKRRRD